MSGFKTESNSIFDLPAGNSHFVQSARKQHILIISNTKTNLSKDGLFTLLRPQYEIVNPCAKSIWKHACSHWACFLRMFTMAERLSLRTQQVCYGPQSSLFALLGWTVSSHVCITGLLSLFCYHYPSASAAMSYTILIFRFVCGNGNLLQRLCLGVTAGEQWMYISTNGWRQRHETLC